ncbi:LysR family transcriptional regulator [uncultured Tateyamaria sp.]|uniref:LysR family transcriptional regulator n=1 Tax=uncultured Tateyamaria sp. TaxID=455651 RepID=UPI0026344E79|nr:LysR family transcriptional regulator [uncultured Tateyamaria sp.]
MRKLDGLAEFCAVVTEGGFTRASETLGVSTSFISRRVAELEARLGVRLLHRTTRSVNLTDIGALYYERANVILDDIATLETDLAEQQNLVKGRVRVAAAGLFGETWVTEQLSEFASQHPQIEVELNITERLVDLIREGFDLAVRYGMPDDQDLVVRKIGKRRIKVCASPSYLERTGLPDTPRDLSAHTCLAAPGQRWMFREGGAAFEVKVSGRWSSNNAAALVKACKAGLGIVRLGENYLNADIDAGHLVRLLEDFETDPQDIVLAYPSRDRLPHRVRALVTFLVDARKE